MSNYITLLLNILVNCDILTKDEAEALDEEFQGATLYDGFEASYKAVKDVFEKLEIDKKKIV